MNAVQKITVSDMYLCLLIDVGNTQSSRIRILYRKVPFTLEILFLRFKYYHLIC